MTCMNEAFENVLIPTCDELLFKTYGLSLVFKSVWFIFFVKMTKTKISLRNKNVVERGSFQMKYLPRGYP